MVILYPLKISYKILLKLYLLYLISILITLFPHLRTLYRHLPYL